MFGSSAAPGEKKCQCVCHTNPAVMHAVACCTKYTQPGYTPSTTGVGSRPYK